MIDPKMLDDLARRLAESVPETVKSAKADLEKNLRAGLAGTLSRLDLVTREEFETQSAVLARTREKLDALTERLAELEAELEDPPAA